MSKLARPLLTLSVALAMTAAVLCCVFSSVALADGGNDGDFAVADAPSLRDGDKPARTIMIYMDGASSEEDKPVCTAMLKEYMASSFNRDDFRIIVMTGGSLKWHLEAEYLRGQDGNPFPQDGEISNKYNQIWEVYGANDGGYMQLLKGDGITGHPSTEEPMSDPDTLKGFINYAKEKAPADKYDLILNDHGSADIDPFATVDYTAVFSYLSDEPNMSAWKLGKHIVASSSTTTMRTQTRYRWGQLTCTAWST